MEYNHPLCESKITKKNKQKWIGIALIVAFFQAQMAICQIHTEIIFRNLNETVRGISAQKDSSLIFVTESGMIGKMPMSGQNFDSLYFNPYGLSDIDFFSDSLGFTCGEFGRVLKTTDRGITWEPVSMPTSQAFTDIELLQNGFGILAGQNGSLFLTNNFGSSWANKSRTMLGTINRTYVMDSSLVIIHSGNGKLFHYNPITDSLATLTSPIFVDEFTMNQHGFGFASTNIVNKPVYRTTDFGITWAPSNDSIYPYSSSFSEAVFHRGKVWFLGRSSIIQSIDSGRNFELFQNEYNPLDQFGLSAVSESITNFDTAGNSVFICGKNGIIAHINLNDLQFSPISGGYDNTVVNAFQEPDKLVVFTYKSVFTKTNTGTKWKRHSFFSGPGQLTSYVGRISNGNYVFSGGTKISYYYTYNNQLSTYELPYSYYMNKLWSTGGPVYSYGYSTIYNSTYPDQCILKFNGSPYDIHCFPQHTYFAFGKDGTGFKFYGYIGTTSIHKVKNWGNSIYPLTGQSSNLWGESAVAVDSNQCFYYDNTSNSLKRTKDQFATQIPVLQFPGEDNFLKMEMFDSTLIVLTTQGRIYRSRDTGTSWQVYETNFLFFNNGAFSLASPNSLIVSTASGLAQIDLGIWLSTNPLKSNKFNVHIYPNPFTTWLNVDVNEPILQIALLDLNGKIIENQPKKNDDGILTFGYLPGGCYILKIITQNQAYTHKIFRL